MITAGYQTLFFHVMLLLTQRRAFLNKYYSQRSLLLLLLVAICIRVCDKTADIILVLKHFDKGHLKMVCAASPLPL